MSTVLDEIASALSHASRFDPNAQVAPAAVLWPDPGNAWAAVIARLQQLLPVARLGDWQPEDLSGPALWLRALMAGGLELPPEVMSPSGQQPWIIYLPGVSRDDLRPVESVKRELQPIAELQFRATWWVQGNREPWTPASWLRSRDGLGLDLARDAATVRALDTALEQLVDRDVADLRSAGRIEAPDLAKLLVADEIRTLLQWLDHAEPVRTALGPAGWQAFRGQCTGTFGFDPDADTALSAAEKLTQREGAWAPVWERFAENPRAYPRLPALLDQARPARGALFSLDGPENSDVYPSANEEAENDLRQSLSALAGVTQADAATTVLRLEGEHGPRRRSVWADLGRAPLAAALEHLVAVVGLSAQPVTGGTTGEMADWYADTGCRVDDRALRAIAATTSTTDRAAVLTALHALYTPWLDSLAERFQQRATASGYIGETGMSVKSGTCIVFVDGLRYDVAHRLVELVAGRSLSTELSHRLAAFPTVTSTGQPAVAPLSGAGPGPGFAAGDSEGRALVGERLHKCLAAAGAQFLAASETGDPAGVAWTQTGDLDSNGHGSKHKLADDIDRTLRDIGDRVEELLSAGWGRVVVVTDHGFLLMPRPMRKVELPLHLTHEGDCRKGRVARLAAGAAPVGYPTAPWTWDPEVSMVSAPGVSAFVGGILYDHGGLSLQECVIPVLTVSPGSGSLVEAKIEALKWIGMRCRVDVSTSATGLSVELRTRPGDPGTRIGGPKQVQDGEAKMLVTDQDVEGAEAFVVLFAADGHVIGQRSTHVGGSGG